MQRHIAQCVFGNIECPYLHCTKWMQLRDVADHLKDTHGKILWVKAKGPQCSINFNLPHQLKAIKRFDGYSFILNCYKEESTLIFWVQIIGTEEDAQQYEVKMSATSVDATTNVNTQGKVYSIEKRKGEVLNESDGFLEIGKKMATRLVTRDADGELGVEVIFIIVRK